MKSRCLNGARRWLAFGGLVLLWLVACPAMAQDQWRYSGDVGVGAYRIDTMAGPAASPMVFPYLYGDWGPLYARVDTFGVKTAALGHGHLELSARISFEGYRPTQAGVAQRTSPRLMGLGTFQETPVGGFFLYAFHDSVSGGAMLDATYAAELTWGRLTVYPQLGVTHRSRAYVQHLYGVSAAESGLGGATPYQAASSSVPNAGWAMEVDLGGSYKLVGEFKRRWLDRSISASPLVNKQTQNSAMLALARAY